MGHPERKWDDNEADDRTAFPSARWSPAVRRSYPRYSVTCPVALQPEGGGPALKGTAVNVSRGGALLRLEGQLDEHRRYLVLFLPDEQGLSFAGHTCPDCGHSFGAHRLERTSVWARVLRQGCGGGAGADRWAAAVEFDALLDLHEDETDGE